MNLNDNHTQLESAVKRFFYAIGYVTGSQCYHDNPEFIGLSKITNDPTAMVIRTEADFVIYKNHKAYWVETKTGTKSDMICIEAFPLIRHSDHSNLYGTETLYVCENKDKTFVFATSDLPKIARLVIMDGKTYPCKDMIEKWAKEHDIPVIHKPGLSVGSSDPYFVITKESYDRCFTWTELSCSLTSN